MAMGRREKGRQPAGVVIAALERGNPKSMRVIGAAWTPRNEDSPVKYIIKLDLLPMSSTWDGTIMVRDPYDNEEVDPETGEVRIKETA
jgi:hypothetical protein